MAKPAILVYRVYRVSPFFGDITMPACFVRYRLSWLNARNARFYAFVDQPHFSSEKSTPFLVFFVDQVHFCFLVESPKLVVGSTNA